MIDYYAKRAGEYERIYQKPERQADLALLRQFIEDAFAGANVIEIACGTGYWTQVLARSAASVLGIDVSEETLAIARSKPLGNRVEFQRADAYALPPLARKFNAALAAFWWSHVPRAELDAFLKGLHHALPAGARVVFVDNLYVEGSSTPIARTDTQGNTYQIRALDDGSKHEVLKNFPTESELRTAAADSASDIELLFLRYYWILAYRVRI